MRRELKKSLWHENWQILPHLCYRAKFANFYAIDFFNSLFIKNGLQPGLKLVSDTMAPSFCSKKSTAIVYAFQFSNEVFSNSCFNCI